MFNFAKKLFSSKNENSTLSLVAPVSGTAIPLSQVPDKVFADKLAGDGMAIIPNNDTIVAPADGELTLIFKTKHAFAMTLSNGLEILIHIGVDTVSLNGEGFEQLAEAGTIVKAGTPIIKIDKNLISNRGLSLATPILITNMDSIKSINPIESGTVIAGETTIISINK